MRGSLLGCGGRVQILTGLAAAGVRGRRLCGRASFGISVVISGPLPLHGRAGSPELGQCAVTVRLTAEPRLGLMGEAGREAGWVGSSQHRVWVVRHSE